MSMNRILWKLGASCLFGLFSPIPAVNGQGMNGMNASINQVEAIESHLQQSRTLSNREAEESARKKPKIYGYTTPVTNAQPPTSKKVDGDKGKGKVPAANDMKNE